ncbi:MAG: GyrI-like domain-containing protein [Planctomycetes bacterium]|nr:GyrI-like domain-containing protein [Planctomycetota bacterium]
MIEPPAVVESTAQTCAAIHLCIPRQSMPEVMGPAIGELLQTLAAQGLAPAGPILCHHHRLDPAEFDFDLCVPVAGAVAATGRVRAHELPAARVVRTVMHGDYALLPHAWGELMKWIGAQELAVRDELWERYLVGPESSERPADWRTELNRVLAD